MKLRKNLALSPTSIQYQMVASFGAAGGQLGKRHTWKKEEKLTSLTNSITIAGDWSSRRGSWTVQKAAHLIN